jgi:hypothetical protein
MMMSDAGGGRLVLVAEKTDAPYLPNSTSRCCYFQYFLVAKKSHIGGGGGVAVGCG